MYSTLVFRNAQGIEAESPQRSEDLQRIARPEGMRHNKRHFDKLSAGLFIESKRIPRCARNDKVK